MTNREFLKNLVEEDKKNFSDKELAAIKVRLSMNDDYLNQEFVDEDEAFKVIDEVCMMVV